MIFITISISVTKGSCEDPFNSTSLYYYGDIIDDFKCDPGMQPTSSRPLQCLMDETTRIMKWNDTFPHCKCRYHSRNIKCLDELKEKFFYMLKVEVDSYVPFFPGLLLLLNIITLSLCSNNFNRGMQIYL